MGWYESFFPHTADAKQYQAIGEFTPRYLVASRETASRIAEIKTYDLSQLCCLVFEEIVWDENSAYIIRIKLAS